MLCSVNAGRQSVKRLDNGQYGISQSPRGEKLCQDGANSILGLFFFSQLALGPRSTLSYHFSPPVGECRRGIL